MGFGRIDRVMRHHGAEQQVEDRPARERCDGKLIAPTQPQPDRQAYQDRGCATEQHQLPRYSCTPYPDVRDRKRRQQRRRRHNG